MLQTFKYCRQTVLLFLLAFFSAVLTSFLFRTAGYYRMTEDLVEKASFRSQTLPEEILDYMRTSSDPGKTAALYWMATDFGTTPFPGGLNAKTMQIQQQIWETKPGWEEFLLACRTLWNDVVFFPVPEASDLTTVAEVTYSDSWMADRSYGGNRGHEGTDLMAQTSESGFYPIISMTDGTVLKKGWLEQGGWRIGILSPSGAYFYYAHLESYADLEEGDTVQAGDLLGWMGNTGYSPVEGTSGNFPVHLHLGIYLYREEKEISVNPYPILRYIEDSRVKCKYSR